MRAPALAVSSIALGGLLSLAISAGVPGQTGKQKAEPPPMDPLASYTARIVRARTMMEGYVRDVKRQYQPPALEYGQARRKYLSAEADYSAWVAAVKMAISEGHVKKLGATQFQALGDAAQESGDAFINYAESVSTPATGEARPTKGASPALTLLGNLAKMAMGITQQTAKSSSSPDQRQTLAAAFATDAQWRTWDDIPVADSPPAKPQPPAEPNITSLDKSRVPRD